MAIILLFPTGIKLENVAQDNSPKAKKPRPASTAGAAKGKVVKR